MPARSPSSLFTTSDGSTYVGTFEDLPDRLVVSSSTETLTLVRGG